MLIPHNGGGDKDYNDFAFLLTNVIDPPAPGLPEPSSLALLGMGLVGAGFARRRRNRATAPTARQ